MRTSYLAVLLVFLFVAAAFCLDKELLGEAIQSRLANPATGEIDWETAELLWISCKQDLIDLDDDLEDSDFCLPGGRHTPYGIDKKYCSLAKQNHQKLINLLHSQSQQNLLDCARKNNILFGASAEKSGPSFWTTKYFRLLVPRGTHSRKLAESKNQKAPSSESPALGPSPTPTPAPGPAFESPTYSPRPSPAMAPSRRRPVAPFFPPNSRNSKAVPPATENSSGSSDSSSQKTHAPTVENETSLGGSNSTSNVSEKKNHTSTIIIAVAVTASVTFVFAALFFLCCSRMCGKGSQDKRNDERPLLTLSRNDYSGSSLPYAFGNSIKEDKLIHQSFNSNSSLKEKASPLYGDKYVESNALPPPPGRTTGPSGLAPLQPTPGRAVPLPPEPPAPHRASPHPPPPPPPAPFASGKPSSASANNPPPAPPPPPTRPPPPSMPTFSKSGPPPPPPAMTGVTAPRPPPPMPLSSKVPRPPSGPKVQSKGDSGQATAAEGGDVSKAKLKPFFWDKVSANPEHSMVWNQIKSGSFQFNEEMIETLFGYANVDKNKNHKRKESSSKDPSPQFIQILEPKKAQNLSILLKALNVTQEEVSDALLEGNELPSEFLHTLLKMAPTTDEELRLRLFSGDVSQLGPADRFLKTLVDIPFAFKRIEALLFMCTVNEEVTTTRESFGTLEVACRELMSSRLFFKLLEAVLKTGNRMNDGTYRGGAQAFKLDTLLKLSDVKGVDGKTTLLHFVVREVIRSEGLRAARTAKESRNSKSDYLLGDASHDTELQQWSLGLQVVSRLSSELENVKKAAGIDGDNLTGTVSKLGNALLKVQEFLNSEMKNSKEDSGFHRALKSFVRNAEADVMSLLEEEKRIMALVKSTGDYFHGNSGKDEGLRLFVIVRDFLIILDKVCKQVEAPIRPSQTHKEQHSSESSISESRPAQLSPDLQQRLFPAIAEQRRYGSNSSSSSDDESS